VNKRAGDRQALPHPLFYGDNYTMSDKFIERRIVTGFIISDAYVSQIIDVYDPAYIEASVAKQIISWCVEHYRKYKKAPGIHIEDIFTAHLPKLQKEQAQDIEEILEGLSDEYERKQFNADYLLDQTKEYFDKQNVAQFAADINDNLEKGDVGEAKSIASNFKTPATEVSKAIDPFKSPMALKEAFQQKSEPLIKFPRALGQFWNDQLVRGGFVALLGPEKRGKTFMLLELAVRGIMSGSNVVFFQAGDMSEKEQLRRMGIYFSKRSDKEKYCKGMYIPVIDCMYNQNDSCRSKDRECDFGIFEELEDEKFSKITMEQLVEKAKEFPDYIPCRNCQHAKIVPWIKWRPPVPVLTWKYAYKKMKAFRKKYSKQFKLVTYPNDTLNTHIMGSQLDLLEREGFIPDICLLDYADIMGPEIVPGMMMDFRNQQNQRWKSLRRMSQERHALYITATQADAASYEQDTLNKSNFSEDKRKYAHVTAMYGLNQTEREKQIGIMRLNELVVRDGDFNAANQCKILQRLQMGRPFLGSYL